MTALTSPQTIRLSHLEPSLGNGCDGSHPQVSQMSTQIAAPFTTGRGAIGKRWLRPWNTAWNTRFCPAPIFRQGRWRTSWAACETSMARWHAQTCRRYRQRCLSCLKKQAKNITDSRIAVSGMSPCCSELLVWFLSGRHCRQQRIVLRYYFSKQYHQECLPLHICFCSLHGSTRSMVQRRSTWCARTRNQATG